MTRASTHADDPAPHVGITEDPSDCASDAEGKLTPQTEVELEAPSARPAAPRPARSRSPRSEGDRHRALGLGNVGLGTARILEAHAGDIERRLGAKVRVRHVLVRDAAKSRQPSFLQDRITTDYEKILADPQVEIVAELMGGVDEARAHLLRAIDTGRHVVTANKALLSQHGRSFLARAQRGGPPLEGAVCGGIPIIRTL